jgi:hypothetical protein
MVGAVERGFYIVRVWSEREGFRAEVRDVRNENGLTFTEVTTLARFFAAASCPLAPAPMPPADSL